MTSQEVQVLLDRLCVEFGFCLPAEDREQLCTDPPEEARDFVDEVYRREGLDPQTADRHLYRVVRDKVILAYQMSKDREWGL